MNEEHADREFAEDLSGEKKLPAIEWLAEQMPGGFFIYRDDEEQEILYVNKPTCRIFGCETLEEFKKLTGYTFRGMVHPDDFLEIQNSIDKQIAEDSAHKMDYVEYRIIRKDGSIRWVDDYGHHANLPGFGDVYYVFIGDITDTRKVKEEQQRNKMLAQALEAAEQASLAKTSFLSNMSHEIRTPITAILGMNEMILRESVNPKILEYSENIRQAGVSLLGIISDILDFSKIEAGKMELTPVKYSLKKQIADIYNLIRFRAEAKALSLDFSIDPNIPDLLIGDELRIKQVVTNLMSNAVKYTEKGSICLKVSMLKKEEDVVELKITIEDTGIGIRKEEMDELLSPFERLDISRNRSIEGTGLGLAITAQLLSLMGSELEVESEYQVGSKFNFTLRQKIADETPIGEFDIYSIDLKKADGGKKRTFFVAPGARILVVDDTPMNLQVIAGLLKRTGVSIDTAESGEECIEKFGENDYHLVFLDYRMPGLDGIETLKELFKRFPDKIKNTPVISLTASAVSGDREKMLQAGFTDYMAKPVNIEEMEEKMARYLPEELTDLLESPLETPVAEILEEYAEIPEVLINSKLINPKDGIEYCGDLEEYIFAINIYKNSIEEKAKLLEKNFSEKDMAAFTLNSHSLKSTSMAIGSSNIFERARALEEAGKEENYDYIYKVLPGFLRDYRSLKEILDKAVYEFEKN